MLAGVIAGAGFMLAVIALLVALGAVARARSLEARVTALAKYAARQKGGAT